MGDKKVTFRPFPRNTSLFFFLRVFANQETLKSLLLFSTFKCNMLNRARKTVQNKLTPSRPISSGLMCVLTTFLLFTNHVTNV